MKHARQILMIGIGLVAALAASARAQNYSGSSDRYENAQEPHDGTMQPYQAQPGESEPMSMEEQGASKMTTEDASTSTTTDSGGFWIFPEPAPMDGQIVTDRPGFSDSAALVPRGHFQIESGYTFTYDRENRRRVIDHQAPEIAFRTGLTDWLELRAKWNGYSWSEILDRVKTRAGRHVMHEDHVDGGSDLNLGFKLPILRQYCDRFNLSFIPSLYVPTGSDSKSANNVVPEFKFPWNYSVCDDFTVYGSILGRLQDGDGQYWQTAATLACAYHFNDCVSAYVEYYGLYPASRTQDCLHLLSAGPIFHITDNLSIDMRAAVGLNEQAPDFQASMGFGIRF